ncbi:hypothetical protein ACFHW2_21145 [Actinomadura sp. LOL_016]|uniref:hypothetical protein n=1 Tax=Actinomadura sp. LOL_016 TaxID=3345411 RepID=UPI003A89CF22
MSLPAESSPADPRDPDPGRTDPEPDPPPLDRTSTLPPAADPPATAATAADLPAADATDVDLPAGGLANAGPPGVVSSDADGTEADLPDVARPGTDLADTGPADAAWAAVEGTGAVLPATGSPAAAWTGVDRTRAVRPPARRRGRVATGGVLTAVATAILTSVLAVPDATIGVVPDAADALGLDDAHVAGLLRATGLTLPALVLTVPLAALAARRLPTWAVLAAGLLTLLAGLGAARAADSVAFAGTVRALQGAGAGIALPAAFVLAWERGGRAAASACAGALAAGLLLATPLVLDAVPQPPAGAAGAGRDWRAALAPWTWPALAALAAVLAHHAAAGRAASPP